MNLISFTLTYEHHCCDKGWVINPAQQQLVEVLEKFHLFQQAAPLALLRRFIPKKTGRGLYIYGPVGGGKTMIMDMFYDWLDCKFKQRYHFNDFMVLWQHYRQQDKPFEKYPVKEALKKLSKDLKWLFIDEFQVQDIGDAMILKSIFEGLHVLGVNIVVTSNCNPDDLYKGGQNYEVFAPFIKFVQQNYQVFSLTTTQDYRRRFKNKQQSNYYAPITSETQELCRLRFLEISSGKPIKPLQITLNQRVLTLHEAAENILWTTFQELCDAPLGKGDYIAIAGHFSTVFLMNVPVLTIEHLNQTRRFITLIDALYDKGIKLVVTAAAFPDELYIPSQTSCLPFGRTASRLIEMQYS